MTTIEELQAAIARERAYQDAEWGTVQENPHDLAGWLAIAQEETEEAYQAWIRKPGDREAKAELLQAVAVGIAWLDSRQLAYIHHDYPRNSLIEAIGVMKVHFIVAWERIERLDYQAARNEFQKAIDCGVSALLQHGIVERGGLVKGSPAPLRAVAHVELLGEAGKEEWCLTLECGHFAWRRPKRLQAHHFSKGEPSGAPQRVRCQFCMVLQEVGSTMATIEAGKLAITPYAPRSVVRIIAEAGVFDGKQMVEVEYIPGIVATEPGYTGCHYLDMLTPVAEGCDMFCRACGHMWQASLDHCPECGCGLVGTIPIEVTNE